MNYKQYAAAGAAGLAVSLSAQASGTLFSGSIQYDLPTGPIIATGDWDNSATTLSWDISYVGGSHPWQYSYTWETDSAAQSLSHIIFELSSNTVIGDFSYDAPPVGSIADVAFGNQDAGGGANPDMPVDMFGLKFDTQGDPNNLTITFSSTRPPTWGDFYAKAGQSSAYNAGFTDPDTDPIVDFAAIALGDLSSLQHDGTSRSIHIAVPDTIPRTPRDFDNPVPEPGTVAAGLGLGALALGTFLRRKR